MALATIRVDSYNELRTLIDANKLSGSVVVNSFPESNPSFPCYILPTPEVGADTITLGDLREYNIEVPMEIVAKRSDGQKKVAQMLDNLQNTLETNALTTLKFESLSSGGPPDPIEVNGDKLYAMGVILTFNVLK